MPGGPGDVLAPVSLDVAALVGAGGDPPHRAEPRAGKGAHGGEILPIGLSVRPAVEAARRRVDPRASPGEERVELGECAERRHGDEEVAPEEPHGVLDGALLVSQIGVAVSALEAVVGSELREQPRFRDLTARHPARLGGVVERHRRRGAAPAAEDLGQPGAQALRPLRHEGDALPVVRVREHRDQQLEVEGPPADRGAEVPEIDLAGAGRPLELEAPLSARRPGEPELADEPLHGGARAGVAALGDQPVVGPPGGAALLSRGPRPASRTLAAHSSLSSGACLPLPWGIGAAGDMSSVSAYFAAVFRPTWGARAISDLEDYIVHWNTRRRQKGLKGLTPEEFRSQSLMAV